MIFNEKNWGNNTVKKENIQETSGNTLLFMK